MTTVRCVDCGQIVEVPPELAGDGEPAPDAGLYLCDACDNYDDEPPDQSDWDDDLDDAMSECGYFPESGACLQAGTEYCDWECSLRSVWEKPAKAAKRP